MKKALIIVLILTFIVLLPLSAEKKKTPEPQPVVTVEQLIADGQYQQAIDLGAKISAQGQETAGLLINIGVAYYKLKDYTNSLAFLEKAFAKASDPLAPDTQLQLHALLFEATIHHEMNNEDKVAEVYAKALGIAPEDKEVLYSYGHILEGKDRAKAFEIYDKLIPIDPLYKNVAYDAGVFALQNDELEKAEKYLTASRTAQPQSEETLLALSKLYLKKKDYEAVIPIMQTIIDTTTREVLKPALLKLLSSCQLETKKPMETIATADKLLLLRPNDEAALLLKGKAYYQMKDLKNATLNLDQALSINPENEDANYFRAKAGIEQKQFKKAKPLFEKVLAVTKDPARKTEVQGYLKDLKGVK